MSSTPTSLHDALFAVRSRADGQWLESWSATGRLNPAWSCDIGSAAYFTRLAVARKAAAKVDGYVYALIPSRLP